MLSTSPAWNALRGNFIKGGMEIQENEKRQSAIPLALYRQREKKNFVMRHEFVHLALSAPSIVCFCSSCFSLLVRHDSVGVVAVLACSIQRRGAMASRSVLYRKMLFKVARKPLRPDDVALLRASLSRVRRRSSRRRFCSSRGIRGALGMSSEISSPSSSAKRARLGESE